ncbi:MAG TPA: alginate lyase family protein [Pyrinomonadaceae bacterium]|nr:alginate lyase family protein [Pyrinomonadaceae bacterium]
MSVLSILSLCRLTHAQTPRVFLWDAEKMADAKRKILAGDKEYVQALEKLKRNAQKALQAENFSVVKKQGTPPSGDKHDYMSQAPYFWKNPKTADGLPYIRRDGERNPEIAKYPDHEFLDQMADSVQALALAYYFTGDEVYAVKAAQQLRVWFLDPATKMNPNMQFAQAVPGESTGRVFGVLESRGLTRVVDSIGLLEKSKAFAKTDRKGIENWFTQFLDWLTTSKNGRGEGETKNNHGTLYDVQVVSYALFLGKKDLAKRVLETAKQKRIASQIEADGRQPLELERTKSWNYSTMNLEGLMWLAKLGENVSVDLWNYQTADGRGIRKALEYLYPFAVGEKKWEYRQIEGWQPQRLFPLMHFAEKHYKDEKFKAMLAKTPPDETTLY